MTDKTKKSDKDQSRKERSSRKDAPQKPDQGGIKAPGAQGNPKQAGAKDKRS